MEIDFPTAEFPFLAALLDEHVTVRPRPRPVSADRRPEWKIAILTGVLANSTQSAARLTKIHAIFTAINGVEPKRTIRLASDDPLDLPLVRYDPSVTRAIQISRGLGLTGVHGRQVQLTVKGTALYDALVHAQVFSDDLEIAKNLASKLSGVALDRVLAGRL